MGENTHRHNVCLYGLQRFRLFLPFLLSNKEPWDGTTGGTVIAWMKGKRFLGAEVD